MYRESAEAILKLGPIDNREKSKIQVLLEAATVAKVRAQTTTQLQRAITYLEAIQHTDFAPHRVLGMLTEFSAAVGDRDKFRIYRGRVNEYRRTHAQRLSLAQREALDEALRRAENHVVG